MPTGNPVWSTACPDWEQRLREGRSIIPAPIYPVAAQRALEPVDGRAALVRRRPRAVGRQRVGEIARKHGIDVRDRLREQRAAQPAQLDGRGRGQQACPSL